MTGRTQGMGESLGATNASRARDPGESGGVGGRRQGPLWRPCRSCVTTLARRGLESNAAGKTKAPIQAVRRIWPPEEHPASHLILQFLQQSLSSMGAGGPQPCQLYVVETQWTPSSSRNGHNPRPFPFLENLWRSAQKTCRKTSLPLLRCPIYFHI